MIARIQIEHDGREHTARLVSPRHRHRRGQAVGHEGWTVGEAQEAADQVHNGDTFTLRLANPNMPVETVATVVNAEWAKRYHRPPGTMLGGGSFLELSVDLGEYDHAATRGAK